ncbi:MAG: hypothetical protein M1818_008324 [Claussenomyces sp. TS43310]|nr:MAG: hypothetical protein M1818_008324 [Claussenomyces sp. TS43310]
MSPVTLQQQVEQFTVELSTCIQLCKEIRTNVKFASTHHNLDRLQTALEISERSIPETLTNARRRVGSQVERGDGIAITEMHSHIQDLQGSIKPKLRGIAAPGRKPSKHPGFSKLNEAFKPIHKAVLGTISTLSTRILDADRDQGPSHPRPAPAPAPERYPDSAAAAARAEVVISRAEYDELRQYRRSCWLEILHGGRIRYINAHDDDMQTWERPENAFIKDYVRPSRTPSFERTAATRRTSRA